MISVRNPLKLVKFRLKQGLRRTLAGRTGLLRCQNQLQLKKVLLFCFQINNNAQAFVTSNDPGENSQLLPLVCLGEHNDLVTQRVSLGSMQ